MPGGDREGQFPRWGAPAGISHLTLCLSSARVDASLSHKSQALIPRRKRCLYQSQDLTQAGWEGMRSRLDAVGQAGVGVERSHGETPPAPAARMSLLHGVIRTGLQQGWGRPR